MGNNVNDTFQAEVFEQPMNGDQDCCYGVMWDGLKIYCANYESAKKVCNALNNHAVSYVVTK